ncbi:MAG: GatB/YqeY domain-containing protein, partial [Candidatus Vogelbacteria bacterium]|nr:GatB/YqeY domain-containing protein [Candidatus Vogelbacteria bacterium]
KDADRLRTVRSISAAFTNELVAKRRKPDEILSDEEAIAVIKRQAKQRKDSIEQFRAGEREDLAVIEEAELKIIETFLPAQMSREEIQKIAEAKKAELGITDKTKFGQLMGAVTKEIKGAADGNLVKEVVESLFS